MGKLCNSGRLCVSGELEGGLTLRTQLRHGEQRASRCSLGVARSPVHIIFPPHHNGTHMGHRGQCAQGHTCDLVTRGDIYIKDVMGNRGTGTSPATIPPISQGRKVIKAKHVCQGGKVENYVENHTNVYEPRTCVECRQMYTSPHLYT